MGISSKVAVAGAAGLFGLVIAAGGAIAASGATLVADAPGTSLRVQGIGAPPATEIGKTARLKLLAAADGVRTIQTVFPAAAITLSTAPAGSTSANDKSSAVDTSSSDEVTPNDITPVPGTGNDGIAGNGNTNNGKGNGGISGNGNTDNGHGNSGNNGNGNPGNNGNGNPGNGVGNGNPGQPGPGLNNPGKGHNK